MTGSPFPFPFWSSSPMRRKRTLILTVVAAVAAAATAWIALPASAAAPTATVRTVSDWGSGWQDEVTVSNTGAAAMTSWKVEFDLPAGAAIGSFWDAEMTLSGQHVTFANQGWNGSVAVGAKTTFGFVGSGGQPVNCKLNGVSCNGVAATATPTTVAPTTVKPTTAPTTAATTAPTTAAPTTKANIPPASDLLPVTVSNKTGRNETVYLYVLGTNLATGKIFDQTWGGNPYSGAANGFVTGFTNAIVGQTVGSQVLVVIAPADGYGPQGGNSSAGIGKDDTLVFVIDILAAEAPAAG